MALRSPGRIFAAFAVATTLVAAGCTSNSKDSAPKAKMDGDKVVISVLSPADEDTKLDTNAITTLLSDKYKIKFQFQTTTMDGGPAKEKRQISLASGDYPDLFLLIPWVDAFTKTDVQKLGEQGVVVPLEDLIKQYAPNIQKALDSNPVLKAMSTTPDGHIYSMPQWSDCYHCTYPDKLWINSAWLKKLHLQIPKTTEELRTVLKAFKTQDPNGNGKADEIPMTTDTGDSSLLAYLMNAFTYVPYGANPSVRSLLELNGDTVATPVDKPEWREGLKYINSLYKEGLIDQAAFTQNAEALHRRQQPLGRRDRLRARAVARHLRPARLQGRPGQAVRLRATADRARRQELHRIQQPDLNRLHLHADQQVQQGGAYRRDQDARLHLHRRGTDHRQRRA